MMALLLAFPFIFLGLEPTWTSLYVMASCMILIILHEDYLYNIVNPWEEYGYHVSFVQKHFPAMGGKFIDNIPLEYYLEAIASYVVWWFSGEDMIIWLEVFAVMLVITCMITMAIPVFFKRHMKEWAKELKRIAIKHLIYMGDEEYDVIVRKKTGEIVREFTIQGISPDGRFNPEYSPKDYMEDCDIEVK